MNTGIFQKKRNMWLIMCLIGQKKGWNCVVCAVFPFLLTRPVGLCCACLAFPSHLPRWSVLCLGLAVNLSSSLAWSSRSWSCSACSHHRGKAALVLRGEGRRMEIIPHLRSSTKGGLASAAKSLLQVCPLRPLLPV